MRALNDLVIRGPRSEVAAFLQRLEGSLTGGWRRDRELEARLHGMGVGGEDAFCFSCTEAPERPAAALWLQARGPEEWYVSNIVPLGRHTLSDEEYNHVLDEFESRFLEPLSRGSTVHSEILPARTRLEDYLSPEAARLLRAFSAAANRTAPHPSDQQRWQQFLVRAHQEESIMDAAFLEEWLASEGWPEEARVELVREYESGRRLLWNYDEEQRR
jgi:hypothetical protein